MILQKMGDEKEIIGYFTDDRNIYCVECINKNREIMEKIERAITADDIEEGELLRRLRHCSKTGQNTFQIVVNSSK